MKPNGGGGVIGTTASEYTRRISRPAERQAMSRIEAQARRSAKALEILGAYA